MYKEQAVREPSLSRLKEIAIGLGLDMEESELQEYQSMLSKVSPINTLISNYILTSNEHFVEAHLL